MECLKHYLFQKHLLSQLFDKLEKIKHDRKYKKKD